MVQCITSNATVNFSVVNEDRAHCGSDEILSLSSSSSGSENDSPSGHLVQVIDQMLPGKLKL